jgi:hypothetical protein
MVVASRSRGRPWLRTTSSTRAVQLCLSAWAREVVVLFIMRLTCDLSQGLRMPHPRAVGPRGQRRTSGCSILGSPVSAQRAAVMNDCGCAMHQPACIRMRTAFSCVGSKHLAARGDIRRVAPVLEGSRTIEVWPRNGIPHLAPQVGSFCRTSDRSRRAPNFLAEQREHAHGSRRCLLQQQHRRSWPTLCLAALHPPGPEVPHASSHVLRADAR